MVDLSYQRSWIVRGLLDRTAWCRRLAVSAFAVATCY
jgi:hypothetical protein